MIKRGTAHLMREANDKRHPAWEWDDRLWAYLETLEDEYIALQERLEMLESELYDRAR